MNRKNVAILIAPIAVIAAGCAQSVPPKSLVDARTDYAAVRDGTAMQFDPTDVHEADVALKRAEQAFTDAPNDQSTVELAMIADRKALFAQSQAATIQATGEAQRAKAQTDATNAQSLQNTRTVLGATQMQLQQTAATAASQQAQLADLTAKLKDAHTTLAKIAAIKDDDRGMVITLQGEVLFLTGKFDLKPAAMAKLDMIAQALEGKDQPIVVYGFTDDVGTRDHNMGLSQSRAQTVRDYLVSKGMPKDLVDSKGQGPDSPVAPNTSVEGRAQNRRVEIVVQPKK